MFDEFYVRLPYEHLKKELGLFQKQGLQPEIYIGNRALQQFSETDVPKGKKMVRTFPSHTLHAPFMDIFPGAQDDEIRMLSFTKMQKIMDIARQWDSRLVVMHFNYDPVYYHHHFPEWIRRTADFYQKLLKLGQKTWVALENVADPDPFVSMHLVEAIGDPRVIHCLDLGHHHVFGAIPFEEWLLYLSPQTHIHFHFHDNNGNEDDHLPLGSGTIDWQHVKTVLKGLHVNFSVGLEPHNAPDLQKTVASYKRIFL